MGENMQRDEIVMVYNRYNDFFGAVTPSLFVTFVIKLASVFDWNGKGQEENITLKMLPDHSSRAEFSAIWETGRKLYRYRSKMIAHRDMEITERDFARDSGFTWNALKDLLNRTCELFDAIAVSHGFEKTHAISCKYDLQLLLDDLAPVFSEHSDE